MKFLLLIPAAFVAVQIWPAQCALFFAALVALIAIAAVGAAFMEQPSGDQQ